MKRDPLAWGLGIVFLLFWAAMAIDPLDRSNWWLENLLVFLLVPVVILIHRWNRFSPISLVCLFVFACLHVVGSHWSYSNVPIPFQEWGMTRNPYDRWVHFSYGFLLALPTYDVLRRLGFRPASSRYFAVEFLLATSALYEVIEYVVVLIVAPGLGAEFLGAQGDEFDAVADMGLAGLGALIVVSLHALVALIRRRATAKAA